MIKEIIKQSLAKCGIGIKQLKRNFDVIILEILNEVYGRNKQVCVFDVGASNGTSIERFCKMFDNKLEIYSFEPSEKVYGMLDARFGNCKNIHILNCAIGSKSEKLLFNEHQTSSGSSSFQDVIDNSFFAQRRNIKTENIKSYDVEVISIDEFSAAKSINHINLLKVDVQGFEAEVLCGCKDLLLKQKIDLIELEVIVTDAYKNQMSFYNIEKCLIEYGYRLVALSDDGRSYNMGYFDIIKNPELQFDVIYASPNIYKKLRNIK